MLGGRWALRCYSLGPALLGTVICALIFTSSGEGGASAPHPLVFGAPYCVGVSKNSAGSCASEGFLQEKLWTDTTDERARMQKGRKKCWERGLRWESRGGLAWPPRQAPGAALPSQPWVWSVQGQPCGAWPPPYFCGQRCSCFALEMGYELGEVCWAAGLVVINPGRSRHPERQHSALVNATAMLGERFPLFVTEYF